MGIFLLFFVEIGLLINKIKQAKYCLKSQDMRFFPSLLIIQTFLQPWM